MIGTVRGNPFETLGLTPSAIEGLSNRQIFQLAGAVYRSLCEIHDPENGGLKRRFQAIAEAWIALNDCETFFRVKEEYLTPTEDEIAALKKELRRFRVLQGDSDSCQS